MKNPANMKDHEIIIAIRRIEQSPSAHRSWKIQQMVTENLNALRTEAQRRGI